MKKIILLGYMGSGKSVVGSVLAKNLNLNFIDLDSYIESKEECSIDEIFKTKGELYFRKLENKSFLELINSTNTFILSLGGGTPCYYDVMNVANNTKSVFTFYLQTTVKTLSDRLFIDNDKRPLLNSYVSKKELALFIGNHLFERSNFYNKASYTVSTEDKEPIQIAQEIIEVLM